MRAELIDVERALDIRDELLWQSSDLAERNPTSPRSLQDCASHVAVARLLVRSDADLVVVVDDEHLGAEVARIARDAGAEVRTRFAARRRLR